MYAVSAICLWATVLVYNTLSMGHTRHHEPMRSDCVSLVSSKLNLVIWVFLGPNITTNPVDPCAEIGRIAGMVACMLATAHEPPTGGAAAAVVQHVLSFSVTPWADVEGLLFCGPLPLVVAGLPLFATGGVTGVEDSCYNSESTRAQRPAGSVCAQTGDGRPYLAQGSSMEYNRRK